VGSSRSATRHQSFTRSSPSAIARMINDVACEPELPPELTISGTNSDSTSARLSSSSKPCIALAVNSSPMNRRQSHTPRFRIMPQKLMDVYGSSSASMPPIFWTSSVCSWTMTSMTSSTVTTPIRCPLSLTTGTAIKS
jgi:hypothetical protein